MKRISTVALDGELRDDTKEEIDLVDSRRRLHAGTFLDRLAADSLRFFRPYLVDRRGPVSGSTQAHRLAIPADHPPCPECSASRDHPGS